MINKDDIVIVFPKDLINEKIPDDLLNAKIWVDFRNKMIKRRKKIKILTVEEFETYKEESIKKKLDKFLNMRIN